jgi:hypothetical protein
VHREPKDEGHVSGKVWERSVSFALRDWAVVVVGGGVTIPARWGLGGAWQGQGRESVGLIRRGGDPASAIARSHYGVAGESVGDFREALSIQVTVHAMYAAPKQSTQAHCLSNLLTKHALCACGERQQPRVVYYQSCETDVRSVLFLNIDRAAHHELPHDDPKRVDV